MSQPIIDYSFQDPPAQWLKEKFEANEPGMLVSCVGSGKTYMLLKALKACKDPSDTLILVTKKSVIQWLRVVQDFGLQGKVAVIAHEEIRASMGEIYLTWTSKMVQGEITLVPIWDSFCCPKRLIIDESQKAKSKASLLAQIIESFIDIGRPVYLVSATPFALMSETYITCRTLGMVNNLDDWCNLLSFYCGSYDPTKAHPTIMERFNADLMALNKCYKVKGVRFKHKLHTLFTQLEMCERKRPLYDRAYDEFLERVRYAQRKGDIKSPWLAICVAMLQFRKVCEALRSDDLAKRAIEMIGQGKQVIIFFNFNAPMMFCKRFLNKLGIDDSRIAILHGKMLPRNKQISIDRFMFGRADILLTNLKSGGDSLSLHHDRVGTRPRYCLSGVTWSTIDFAQMGGRPHRINSLSDTTLEIITYLNTIEDKVIERLTRKAESMAKLIGKRASFASIFMQQTSQEVDEYIIEQEEKEAEENGDLTEESLPYEEMLGNVEVREVKRPAELVSDTCLALERR